MSGTPHRIVRLTETASTNKDAMRLALSGEALPLWVTAETQTAGRGRAGRSWVSMPGNLHASVALRCSAPLHRAGELALVAAIALFDAVEAVSELALAGRMRLKWPNDLLIGTAKAGGILVESTSAPGEASFLAVIGFGLNVASAPEALGRDVTCLSHHLPQSDRAQVLGRLMSATRTWLDAWNEGHNFERIREVWIGRAGPMGEPLTIKTPQGTVSGSFAGLTETGALRIADAGIIREFSYGDVALVSDVAEGGA